MEDDGTIKTPANCTVWKRIDIDPNTGEAAKADSDDEESKYPLLYGDMEPGSRIYLRVAKDADDNIDAGFKTERVNTGFGTTDEGLSDISLPVYPFTDKDGKYGNANYFFTMPDCDVKITLQAPSQQNEDANWKVTFDLNGGGGAAPVAMQVVKDKSAYLPGQGSMTPPAGYGTFAGWTTTPGGTIPDKGCTPGALFTPAQDTTLYAVWGLNVSPNELNVPDTLYEEIPVGSGTWYQGTDTHDTIPDCLAWLNGNPPVAGTGKYASGNGGQSWNLDGTPAADTTNPLAGRNFAIKLKANCSVSPQTLGSGTLANVKGTSSSPLSITLEPASGSVTVSLSAPGQLLKLAASANLNMTLDGNLTLEGLTNETHAGTKMDDGLGTGTGMPFNSAVCDDTTDNTSGPLIYIDAGNTLTMKGNNVTLCGNTADNASIDGACVYLNAAGAKFVMEGGTIRDNYSINTTKGDGGGVYLSDGEFDMPGGTIENNGAGHLGGGVYQAAGTFAMSGSAKISGNVTGTQLSAAGGGVYNEAAGTFTMSGSAEISGNRSIVNGGGVNANGLFEMSESATICKNTAALGDGGGVCSYGIFRMTGGTISKNDADDRGGGVCLRGTTGTFAMSGSAEISGNNASYGGGVYMYIGSFTVNGGTIGGNTATYNGGGVCMKKGTLNLVHGTVYGNTGSRSGLDNSAGENENSLPGGSAIAIIKEPTALTWGTFELNGQVVTDPDPVPADWGRTTVAASTGYLKTVPRDDTKDWTN
jgi:hypothetical protein